MHQETILVEFQRNNTIINSLVTKLLVSNENEGSVYKEKILINKYSNKILIEE